jgi:predicted secreted protein
LAIAGFDMTVSLATGASATYAEMDGAISISLSDGRDALDVTDFRDSNLRRRIMGLRDLSASIDGDLEIGDTALAHLRHCYTNGLPIILRQTVVISGATHGLAASMLVESLERSASVDGKVEVSVSLQHEGAFDPIVIGSGI